jgi:hypothetical protein
MTHTINIGASFLTKENPNQLIANAFAKAQYPLAITIENHMPRDVVFPEVKGLSLRHVAHASGNTQTVKINSYEQFQRLVSSIEQIAALNGYKLAATISSGETSETSNDPAVSANPISLKKPSEGLTTEQIKDALKSKGIEFAPSAKKSELAALLDTVNVTDKAK